MFDENQAGFYYNGSSHSDISDVNIRMYNRWAYIHRIGSEGFSFEEKSFSKDKKEIVFVNEDDDNDTFPATYRLIGSGNNTKLILSFEYSGKQYELTLDFDADEMHLTEAK